MLIKKAFDYCILVCIIYHYSVTIALRHFYSNMKPAAAASWTLRLKRTDIANEVVTNVAKVFNVICGAYMYSIKHEWDFFPSLVLRSSGLGFCQSTTAYVLQR